MADINLGNDTTINTALNEPSGINTTVSTDTQLNASISDINYIPGYEEAEKQRRENEIQRQANELDRIALYEEMEYKKETDYYKGEDGQDGYSPSASVSKVSDTATITITDKNGTTTASITDGIDGQDGTDGQDGYSPTATVSKSGKVATITITDKNGTTTAEIRDGEDGHGSGDMLKATYDTNDNGIVDNAEKVNNHTVASDVPANAVFTDTTYTAGTGIDITNNVISNTQTSAEWGNITGTLSSQTDLANVLSGKADSSDIPTKVSDLTNDSGFITNTVNNLTNYYLKSETYNKTEIDTLIAQIPGFNVVVVQTLPVSDIDTHTIYLVPKTGSTGDIYDEYLYINNTWELIGNTAVDLSNYYTKPETNTLLNAKQDTLVSGTSIKTINNESLLGSGNITISADDEIAISETQPTNGESLWIKPSKVVSGSGFELNKFFPIGSIYINTNGINPGTFMGGTWESFGAGKVLVGQDTNDTNFDTLLETGGSKYLQAHSHQKTMYFGTANGGYGYTDVIPYSASRTDVSRTIGAGDVSGATTGNSGNLQPYIVVSMWVRTA